MLSSHEYYFLYFCTLSGKFISAFCFFRVFCKTKNQFQAVIQNKTFLLERKYVSEFTTIDLCPKDEANSRSIQCNRSCCCCPLLLLLGLLLPFKWKKMLNDNTHECKTSSPSTYLCKVLHMWNRGAANKQPVAASWWRVSRATTKERQEKTNKRGSNTWGFPWRVLVHKFRVFFWRFSKRGFVLLLLHFFFFSLFLLSLLRVFQWHQQLPSGCWGGALGSIPSLYKSQRDVTGSISQPPSSSSSHPHLTHPPTHPSIRPSLHLLPLCLCVIVWSETSPWHHEAKRFCVKLSEIWLSHLLNVHARTHTRVVGCCRAPILLRGDVGGWHDWDSQRIPPLPPVFAFSLRLVQQVDFSLKKNKEFKLRETSSGGNQQPQPL